MRRRAQPAPVPLDIDFHDYPERVRRPRHAGWNRRAARAARGRHSAARNGVGRALLARAGGAGTVSECRTGGEPNAARHRYRAGHRAGRRGVLRRELGLPATAADPRRQRRRLDPARPGRRAAARQQRPVRVRGAGGHRAARRDLHRRAPDLPAGRRAPRPRADRVDGRVRVQRPPGGALHPAARRHVRRRLRGDAHERGARRGRPGARRAAVHPVALARRARPP